MKKILLSFAICSILYSCSNKENNPIKPDVVLINIDSTVKPENDFFDFANGGWIKNNPIPEEQSSWGIGNLVMEENMKRLREISEKAAQNKDKKGSANQTKLNSLHGGHVGGHGVQVLPAKVWER